MLLVPTPNHQPGRNHREKIAKTLREIKTCFELVMWATAETVRRLIRGCLFLPLPHCCRKQWKILTVPIAVEGWGENHAEIPAGLGSRWGQQSRLAAVVILSSSTSSTSSGLADRSRTTSASQYFS